MSLHILLAGECCCSTQESGVGPPPNHPAPTNPPPHLLEATRGLTTPTCYKTHPDTTPRTPRHPLIPTMRLWRSYMWPGVRRPVGAGRNLGLSSAQAAGEGGTFCRPGYRQEYKTVCPPGNPSTGWTEVVWSKSISLILQNKNQVRPGIRPSH